MTTGVPIKTTYLPPSLAAATVEREWEKEQLSQVKSLPFVKDLYIDIHTKELGGEGGEQVPARFLNVITQQSADPEATVVPEAFIRFVIELPIQTESWPPSECPTLRVGTALSNIRVTTEGEMEPLFYEDDVDWGKKTTSLAGLVEKAFLLFAEGSRNVESLDEDDADNIWAHHPAECLCELFPRAYNDPTLTDSEKHEILHRIIETLNFHNISRQKHYESILLTKNSTRDTYSSVAVIPELFRIRNCWDRSWFADSFISALDDGTAAAFQKILKEEAPGVFSFEMLKSEFCDRLARELTAYEESGLPVTRPNSMNNYGLILNDIGMEFAFDELVIQFLRPLAAALFPTAGGTSIDTHHTFIVHYSPDSDKNLDMHEDDSEITFNVNIRDEFEGAGLTFCGRRFAATHRNQQLKYNHKKGRCVVHRGDQRHGADSISSGIRENLIIWTRSSSFRTTGWFKHPAAKISPNSPDKICMSHTHDKDYDHWMTQWGEGGGEGGGVAAAAHHSH